MSNMLNLVSFGTLALVPLAVGATSTIVTRQCVQLQVPVPIVANNSHYEQPQINSTIDAINWTLNTTTWSTKNATLRRTGPVLVKDTFMVSAQLCVPLQKTTKSSILHIATQGRGFDKRLVAISSSTQAEWLRLS